MLIESVYEWCDDLELVTDQIVFIATNPSKQKTARANT